MAEAQKDISANATKGLPICDKNNGHCAIPKAFGPNSKGAKSAQAAKKKAEDATRKARPSPNPNPNSNPIPSPHPYPNPSLSSNPNPKPHPNPIRRARTQRRR